MTKLNISAGDAFNHLTAISAAGKNKHGQSLWLFRCVCNLEKILNTAGVKFGGIKSCGCLLHARRGTSTQLEAGERFGNLTAIRLVDEPTKGKPRWLFMCACGNETITIAPHVKRGAIRSCGCLRNPNPICEGQTFGEWTAIRFFDQNKTNPRWIFRCSCGKEGARSVGSIVNSGSKSCGCIRKPTRDESRINTIFKVLKAGAKRRSYQFKLSKSDIATLVEQQNWRCIRSGILLDLTIGTDVRPFGPSIDRIDNDRGYEPGNIQLVCNLYNYCKNRFTDADVLRLAEALVENSAPKKLRVA